MSRRATQMIKGNRDEPMPKKQPRSIAPIRHAALRDAFDIRTSVA
jgi:hypothetical protein